jgi:hypothetical protein
VVAKISTSVFCDHLYTHSGAKKTHDWVVDQIADLFRTTYKAKTRQVARNRGQKCGDIELPGYLSLVMDLHITHECWGSSVDPTLNGNSSYPNDIDRSLNEVADDEIRKYRADYDNNPPNSIFFMSVITSTSGRLHSEFVCILFLEAHRETDRFFVASGVHFEQTNSGLFHLRRSVFFSEFRAKVGNTLAKAVALRVNLNLDGESITSRTLANILSINLVSVFMCSSPPNNPVYPRRVELFNIIFSL